MKTFTSFRDVTVSTNVTEQAAYHVDFLKEVDKVPALKSSIGLSRALYRYERYWLPLAKDHKEECLSAPIDIEWVWHCHMLRPKKYRSDCLAVVGHVINHVFRGTKDYASGLKRSKAFWEKKYTDVQFYLDTNIDESNGGSSRVDNDTDEFQSKITYDVIAAVRRQEEFCYNVSLPHYKDQKYLKLGLERYQKMLYLKQEIPDQYLIPCFDNDLIWHTHQLNPLAYEHDMMLFYGDIFDHDDTTNDRSEGSKLTNCYYETIELWSKVFNEPLAQPGAMYRGITPDGLLDKLADDDICCLATKWAPVTIDLVLRIDEEYDGKFLVETNGYLRTKQITCFHKSEQLPYKTEMKFKTFRFDFNTKCTNRIKFEISNKSKSAFYYADPSFNLLSVVEDKQNQNGGTFHSVVPLETEDGKLEITGKFSAPRRGPVVLFIEKGDYKPGTIPENIHEEWGPVNVNKLRAGVDRKCFIATHRFRNHVGSRDLSARVIHCSSICQSFVQVLHRDKIYAVAHFIGTDQLPTPNLVNKPVLTLEPDAGERAMLIKNHKGDWAMVFAKWIKDKKPPQIENAPPNSEGTMHAKVHRMANGKVSRCKLGYTKQTFNFTLDNVTADLPKGTVEIDKETDELVENIALVLCLAILHDRCPPIPL